jgi:hypothetical protein
VGLCGMRVYGKYASEIHIDLGLIESRLMLVHGELTQSVLHSIPRYRDCIVIEIFSHTASTSLTIYPTMLTQR